MTKEQAKHIASQIALIASMEKGNTRDYAITVLKHMIKILIN